MFNTILMRELMNMKQLKIIDVRDPEEHAYGIIPHAYKIPLDTLPQKLTLLDKNDTYYIVCASGSRSLVACSFLSSKGYNVVNVMGGMSAYRGELSYEM